MAITLTHEEAQEAISVAKQAIEDVERLRGELDHVRAEFALENGKDSPADNEHRMCDEEAEKLDRRLTAMRDEHMLATLMMSSKWLQGCFDRQEPLPDDGGHCGHRRGVRAVDACGRVRRSDGDLRRREGVRPRLSRRLKRA